MLASLAHGEARHALLLQAFGQLGLMRYMLLRHRGTVHMCGLLHTLLHVLMRKDTTLLRQAWLMYAWHDLLLRRHAIFCKQRLMLGS